MAKQKAKKHHSRPRGGVSFAQRLAQQKAEQIGGIAIRHFYDPDPEAALRREEENG